MRWDEGAGADGAGAAGGVAAAAELVGAGVAGAGPAVEAPGAGDAVRACAGRTAAAGLLPRPPLLLFGACWRATAAEAPPALLPAWRLEAAAFRSS